MKSLIACLTIFILGFGVYAQKLEDDLAVIMNRLDSSDVFTIAVDVKLYDKKGGDVLYATKASINKKQEASVTIMGEIEIFSNNDVQVNIDHEEKTVQVVSKAVVERKNKKQMDFDTKELIKWFKKQNLQSDVHVTLENASSSNRVYRITGTEEYEEVRLILDMQTKSFKAINYLYAKDSEQKGSFLEIKYTGFKVNTVDKNPTLSNYLIENSGNYQLVGKLKSYQLTSEL